MKGKRLVVSLIIFVIICMTFTWFWLREAVVDLI